MRLPEVVMWHAAYDYVRLTARRSETDELASVLYRTAARGCVARNLEGEFEMRPWFWQGYYGEIGSGAAYGARGDGDIFQASGATADDARSLGLPFDGVPRCDVALTVWYEQDASSTIGRHAQVSRRFAKSKGASGWKVRHIDGGDDGDTTYLGSRTSDTFVRIYDKWRESEGRDDYKYAIRYEVEYKGQTAHRAWSAQHSTAPGREYLGALVWLELARRGVYIPRLADTRLAEAPRREKSQTSSERRLSWLRNQVAPSVSKLLTDGVSRDRIIEELGL